MEFESLKVLLKQIKHCIGRVLCIPLRQLQSKVIHNLLYVGLLLASEKKDHIYNAFNSVFTLNKRNTTTTSREIHNSRFADKCS